MYVYYNSVVNHNVELYNFCTLQTVWKKRRKKKGVYLNETKG